MPGQRIKGQETIVSIIKDGDLQVRIDSITETTTTFMLELLEEEYLGDISSRYDSIFKGMKVSLSGHCTNKQFLELTDSIVRKAQRRAGGAVRIDIATTWVFPNGDLVSVNLPDVHFGEVPVETGSRSGYVQFSLEAQGGDYELL